MNSRRPPLVVRVFRLLLLTYPGPFRDSFAEEMSATFEASLRRARADGVFPTAWLIVRMVVQAPLFGTFERIRRLRASTIARFADRAAHDLRLGLRQIVRRPRPSIVAIGVLAIGLAAATISFSVLRGTVQRGLPFEDAHELVHFERRQGDRNLPVTPHDLADWRAQQQSFEGLAAFVEALAFFEADDGPTARHEGVFVEPAAFELLRARAAHGRVLTAADIERDAAPVIVLSDSLWRSRFGGETSVVGSDVLVNGAPTRVVGIMPPGFGFPIAEAFWVPLRLDLASATRGEGRLDVFGRLKPGVTFEQAVNDFELISARLAVAYPENMDVVADPKTFRDEYIGEEFAGRVRSMVVGAMLVLLIATLNVGNLLLVRQMTRRGDLAVRAALGATRGRLLSLCLGEAAALALCGAALGIALTVVGIGWLRRAWGDISVFELPHGPAALFWWDIRLDPVVLLFVGFTLVLVTILAGALPAWWLARANASAGLRATGRNRIASPGRLAHGLVVAQLAVLTPLLVPVALTATSARDLAGVTTRFATDEVTTARVSLPADSLTFARSLEQALRSDPRIEAASVGTVLPFHPARAATIVLPSAPGVDDPPRVRVATVGADYFGLFATDLVEGRGFSDDDRVTSDPVVVINESLAAQFFPDRPAIGQRIRLGDAVNSWRTVVGIAPDLWMDGERNRDRAGAYLPIGQDAASDSTWSGSRWGSLVVLARSHGTSRDAELAIRDAMAGIDSGAAVFDVQSMAVAIGARAARFRVFGTIYAMLGLAALILAVGGIYGLNAFLVALRTPEFGVRMALGASRSSVARVVMRGVAGQVALGVSLGLIAAYWIAATLAQVLFQVDPRDPMAFGAAAMVVVLATLAACLGPARRASRVDPLTALRAD